MGADQFETNTSADFFRKEVRVICAGALDKGDSDGWIRVGEIKDIPLDSILIEADNVCVLCLPVTKEYTRVLCKVDVIVFRGQPITSYRFRVHAVGLSPEKDFLDIQMRSSGDIVKINISGVFKEYDIDNVWELQLFFIKSTILPINSILNSD